MKASGKSATAPETTGSAPAGGHLFEQVKAQVIGSIHSGQFAVGTLLPAEQDLAQQYGCSSGTVQRALRELAVAGVLRRIRRKGTIVLRPPALGRACLLLSHDEHTNQLLQAALFAALQGAGIDVEMLPQARDAEQTVELLRSRQQQRRADPARFLVTLGDVPLTVLERLQQAYQHRVAFSFHAAALGTAGFHCVGPDLQAMAQQVVEHLLGLGHRRIAAVQGYPHDGATWVSATCGFARCLTEAAGGHFFAHVLGNQDDQSMLEILRKHKVTAYWALNDHDAMGWESRLLRLGYRVPEDVSLIGRWDTPWSRSAPTPLTSPSLDPAATAAAITKVVLAIAHGKQQSTGCTLVTPKLVVRESSRPWQ